MGLFKKVFRPVRKIAKKIIPKEVRPFLPYIAAGFGPAGLAGTKFAMLGTHGKSGDPYTYNHLGGKKYQVISGPKASAIGKKITIEKGREKHDEETIAALVKSSSAKSSQSSKKSSGSLKGS